MNIENEKFKEAAAHYVEHAWRDTFGAMTNFVEVNIQGTKRTFMVRIKEFKEAETITANPPALD